ncbi:MAG: hypothetical protein WB870_07980 [Gallionellaceae bacterium]
MENQYCKDSESNNNVVVCAGLAGARKFRINHEIPAGTGMAQ